MKSFGRQLRSEREGRKIALDEVAEATKIGIRYLRALENDEFAELPGGVFDRGYVRAYAQFVGLDADAAVEAFLAQRGDAADKPEEAKLDELRDAVLARSAGSSRGFAGAGLALGRPIGLAFAVLAALALISLGAWGSLRLLSRPATDPSPPPATAARAEARPAPAEPLPASPTMAAERRDVAEGTASRAEPAREAEPAAAPPTPPAPRHPAAARDSVAVTPAEAAAIEARLVVDRAVSGRANCDNRRVEVLDGMRPGTELELRCSRFLILDASDGGALRLGLAGRDPAPLAEDGVPVERHGIYP